MKNTQSIKFYEKQALNAWERLSDIEKNFFNKDKTIKVLEHQLKDVFSKSKKEIRKIKEKQKYKGTIAYNMLKSSATSLKRLERVGTKEMFFKMFREMYPSLYAKYNSFMYRQGYSSARYFYENAEIIWEDKKWRYAYLELPYGKRYKMLELSLNITDNIFEAEMY